MKRGEKKGLSTIVTTLIFILLVFVAIGIIWVVVVKILDKGKGIEIESYSVNVKVDPQYVKLTQDDGTDCNGNIAQCKNISLKIKREAGGGEVNSVKFLISDGTSTYEETVDVSLDELDEKIYSFSFGSLNVEELKTKGSIIVIPILGVGDEMFSSSMGVEYDFQSKKSKPISLGPSKGKGGSRRGGDTPPTQTCASCSACDTLFSGCNYNECHSCVGACYYKGNLFLQENCVSKSEVCGSSITSCADYSDEECASANDVCNVGNCVLVSGNCQESAEQPPEGEPNLVAYFPFNGNANDESGNNHNGIVNGATLTADRNLIAGKAYHFDGTDDYILLSNSSSLNFNPQAKEFSFGGWVKCSPNVVGTLVSKADFSNRQYQIYTTNSRANVYVGGGSPIDSGKTVCDSTWHHVFVVNYNENGYKFKIYVDGVDSGIRIMRGLFRASR